MCHTNICKLITLQNLRYHSLLLYRLNTLNSLINIDIFLKNTSLQRKYPYTIRKTNYYY